MKRTLQQLAGAAVQKAIYRGQLPRLDGTILCVRCGVPAEVYDHRDYHEPLNVQPMCRSCNCVARHAKGWVKQEGRLTVNAGGKASVLLCEKFRQLVGERGISPTLLELIRAYVKEQEGRK